MSKHSKTQTPVTPAQPIEAVDGRILDRIEKLLALSKSSNVNEAAAAYAKAQELAMKYNVDLSRAQAADEKAQRPFYDLHRWTFTKAFYIGATDTLDQRLKDFRKGIREEQTMVIVLHKDAEAADAWKQHCSTQNYGSVDIRGAYSKQAGYYQGVAAAKSINITDGLSGGGATPALNPA